MSCAQCGASNRRGAKFCRTCGARLPAMTMKACPQCGTANVMDARTCAHCQHVFGHVVAPPAPTPAPAARPRRALTIVALGVSGLLALCLLLAFAAFVLPRVAENSTTPVAANQPTETKLTAAPSSTDAPRAGTAITSTATSNPNPIRRVLSAVVRITTPLDKRPGYSSGGSGSIITARGHILTNLHVVVDPDTGRLYNAKGEILIGITTNPNAPPSVAYRAKFVKGDTQLDLALLQISEYKDGRALPADLSLTVLPIGDSDTLLFGDELTIIGYPSLGGDTVTLTRGTVAGFLSDEGWTQGWIKTDAEINPGNSGGAALDRTGILVGIPSAGVTPKSLQTLPGKLGLIRPTKLAKSLIDLAKSAP